MGNSTSTQRADFLQREDRRFQEIVQERTTRNELQGSEVQRDADTGGNIPLTPRPSDLAQHRSSLYSLFRRQPPPPSTSELSVRAQASVSEDIGEEQEDRPLMTMEDSTMSEASVQDFNPRTMNYDRATLSRQASTMSRLGSRLLPDSVARGLLNSGEETPAEGRALRLGNAIPERVRPTVSERRLPRQTNNNRFSLRESLRSGSFARGGSRRRPIRGPFPPQHTDSHRNPRDSEAERSSNSLPTSPTDGLSEGSSTWRRRVRLSRVRDSLSFPNIFGPSPQRAQPSQSTRISPGRPSRAPFNDDSDHLLPPLPHADNRLEVEDAPHELDAIEPEARNFLATHPTGNIRSFPHALRSRSTRLIRRGEHPPLSQVLQLAAAAIAAQLSGHANPSASGGQPMNGEVFDGSIQNFVQTLQDAATAQAGEGVDGDLADGNLPPVNFLRVFQFPNTEVGTGLGQDQGVGGDPMDIDDRGEEPNTDRSVTLVLVGVRSMPSTGDGSGDDAGNLGTSLDTLFSLPFLPPTNILRNGSSGALFRRSDGRSRFGTRRNSMTNFNSFPAQYESQRHQRTRSTTTRSHADQTFLAPPVSNMPTSLSESPPGPHPPPSTPADARSGAATPNRRPSSASAVHSPLLPNLDENPSSASEEATPNSPFSIARQRRRSDSEFARRPELSSGASRRNGVVEPDNPPPARGRSWLIYVVGTNVSSDHPAFTMPSLFTDNPSYEDMQLLSTLLGPVKPPVATQEDLTSAGGIYRIVSRNGGLLAQPLEGSAASSIAIVDEDRCLICLCDYEELEEVRQLNKCRHVYHRECIDEWLTTGRNSCPMCRGQGVNEKSSTPPQPTEVPAEVE